MLFRCFARNIKHNKRFNKYGWKLEPCKIKPNVLFMSFFNHSKTLFVTLFMTFYCFVINAYELSFVIMAYFRSPLQKLILFTVSETPTVKQGYEFSQTMKLQYVWCWSRGISKTEKYSLIYCDVKKIITGTLMTD